MIVVDSSVWIDYFNGNVTPCTERLDSLLGRQPLCLGDLILTEVLQGFVHDRDYHQAKAILQNSPSCRCSAPNRPFSALIATVS